MKELVWWWNDGGVGFGEERGCESEELLADWCGGDGDGAKPWAADGTMGLGSGG